MGSGLLLKNEQQQLLCNVSLKQTVGLILLFSLSSLAAEWWWTNTAELQRRNENLDTATPVSFYKLLVWSVFDRLWEIEFCVLKVSHELHCKLSKYIKMGMWFHQVLAAVQHSAAGTVSISVVAQLELPSCKHRWVVSGCLLSSSPPQSPSSPTSGEIAHLVCGDRSGSVHCYKITQTASGVSDFPWVKMLLLRHFIHLVQEIGLTFPR